MDQPGHYRGEHYTAYVDRVKQLKRDGKLAEARELLGHLIDAVEAEARVKNWGVAPWYYEQLAIVLQKLGDGKGEIDVLERFALQRHAPGTKRPVLLARLRKRKSIPLR